MFGHAHKRQKNTSKKLSIHAYTYIYIQEKTLYPCQEKIRKFAVAYLQVAKANLSGSKLNQAQIISLKNPQRIT